MEEQFLFGIGLFVITLPGDMAEEWEEWEEHIILDRL